MVTFTDDRDGLGVQHPHSNPEEKTCSKDKVIALIPEGSDTAD